MSCLLPDAVAARSALACPTGAAAVLVFERSDGPRVAGPVDSAGRVAGVLERCIDRGPVFRRRTASGPARHSLPEAAAWLAAGRS
jgi:hypothetical protein